jgi:membrane protease subunit HflC
MMKSIVYALAALALVLLLSPTFVFILDEREMGVVLRFGAPKHEYREPGLYFKLPFVDTVARIPKVKQFWGDNQGDLLPDLPTRDDKKIELTPWAVWRVTDPTLFVQRLRSMQIAEQRVEQIVRSSIRDVVTQHDLEEFVRSTNRTMAISANDVDAAPLPSNSPPELVEQADQTKPKGIRFGRAEILNRIKAEAQKRLAAKGDAENASRGIELIDVGISQSGFVESVREKTFNRWISERQAISARNVNEGERLKAAIINETLAEVAKIEGEGQQKANEIRGTADAEVIQRFADATRKTGDFFGFVRTLEAYGKAIGPDSQLILSADSPFFKFFHSDQTPPPADNR